MLYCVCCIINIHINIHWLLHKRDMIFKHEIYKCGKLNNNANNTIYYRLVYPNIGQSPPWWLFKKNIINHQQSAGLPADFAIDFEVFPNMFPGVPTTWLLVGLDWSLHPLHELRKCNPHLLRTYHFRHHSSIRKQLACQVEGFEPHTEIFGTVLRYQTVVDACRCWCRWCLPQRFKASSCSSTWVLSPAVHWGTECFKWGWYLNCHLKLTEHDWKCYYPLDPFGNLPLEWCAVDLISTAIKLGRSWYIDSHYSPGVLLVIDWNTHVVYLKSNSVFLLTM